MCLILNDRILNKKENPPLDLRANQTNQISAGPSIPTPVLRGWRASSELTVAEKARHGVQWDAEIGEEAREGGPGLQ